MVQQLNIIINNITQGIKMDWVNHMMKINNKFKFQLFSRKVDNLEACYSNILQYDPNQTLIMNPHTFNIFLNSIGVFFTTQQLRAIKDAFGNEEGVKYIDFIQNVRRDITPKRIAAIDHSYSQLSENRDVVQIAHLLKVFDPSNHPQARVQFKKPQQIFEEFKNAIIKRSADSKHLTYYQFKEYYLDVNACIPLQREQFFIDILINGYRLMDKRVTIDRLREMQVTIYEKVRQKTYIKKDQGIKSKGEFRFFDMEDKGVVDYGRFIQTLQRLGCKFTNRQMKTLFEKHADINEKLISYQKMCALLFEMGSGVKDNKNPIFQMAKNTNNLSSTHGMTKRIN